VFSQTSEYALRVIAFLGARDGKPATTRQIAHATRVPEGYLAKVLQSLSRTGLVRSQRGLHGGSVLAKTPGEITIYDVVSAVDSIPRIRTCPLGVKAHAQRLCALHRRLDDALETVEKAFRSSTVADLLEEEASRPLCDVDAPLPDGVGHAKGRAGTKR